VLLLYLTGCACGAVATIVSLASPAEAYTIMLAVVVLAVAAITSLERRGLGAEPDIDARLGKGDP